jgi:hypothetical protein
MTLNLQNANAFEVVVITLQIRATYHQELIDMQDKVVVITLQIRATYQR